MIRIIESKLSTLSDKLIKLYSNIGLRNPKIAGSEYSGSITYEMSTNRFYSVRDYIQNNKLYTLTSNSDIFSTIIDLVYEYNLESLPHTIELLGDVTNDSYRIIVNYNEHA